MKKLICLVLAAIMICALVGCNSVSQSDIDELQQRIAQLEDKNKELEDELRDQKLKFEDKLTQQESKFEDMLNEQKSEYEDKLNEQDKKIEDTQKDLDILQQKLENLTGQKIEFTAEAPEVEPYLMGTTMIKSFHIAPNEEEYKEDYNEFVDYVQNDVKAEYNYDFYLLNPQDLTYANSSYSCSVHAKYKENSDEISEMYVWQDFDIYNDVLGDPYWEDEQYKMGAHRHSIGFIIFMKALSKGYNKVSVSRRSLSLEFGKYQTYVDERPAAIINYFNIYVGSTCIGTCCYYARAYVSQTWLENYLIKNLF